MALTNSVNASSQGYQVLNTSTGAWSGRTFQAGTGITLTNADGTAGNTSIATSSAVAISFATDSGSATPAAGVITFNATASAGSTVAFNGATSIVSLRMTDNLSNTILGNGSGNGSISGTFNTGLGSQVLSSLTSGVGNTGIGRLALSSLTTQSGNVAVGGNSLASGSYAGNTNTAVGQSSGNGITSGSNNAILGYSAMGSATTASNSVAIGYLAYSGSTPTGSFNIAIGSSAGVSYTGSESNNIIIANSGTAADANTIRLGTQGSGTGQQDKCYIAGITGVTVSNTNLVQVNTSTGQLGSTNTPTVTSIAFSPTTGGIVGTTTNDNASAGYVGEYISAQVPLASSITPTNNVITNLTSISLTAGDWDVSGNAYFSPSTSFVQANYDVWISTVSATLPDLSTIQSVYGTNTGAAGLACYTRRISLAATTTVYLTIISAQLSGTSLVSGFIGARRVR